MGYNVPIGHFVFDDEMNRLISRITGETIKLGNGVRWSVYKSGSKYFVRSPNGTEYSRTSFSDLMSYVLNEVGDGGIVEFSAGTFEVDDTINVPNNSVVFSGSGSIGLQYDGGTMFRLKSGLAKAFYITGRKVTLMNMSVIGNKGDADASYEILVHASAGGPTDLHVFNVYVMNANGIGLQLDGGHSTIVGLVTEDNKKGAYVTGNGNTFVGPLTYSDDEIGLTLVGSLNKVIGHYNYSGWTAVSVSGNHNVISGINVETSAHEAINLSGSYNVVKGAVVYGPAFSVGYNGVELGGSFNVFEGIVFSDYTTKPVYGINEGTGADYNRIIATVRGYTTGAVNVVGTNTKADIIDGGA